MRNYVCNIPNDDHIFRMTDSVGMFQHAKYSIPDPSEGYTTDDNARALIMAIMLNEANADKKYLNLVYKYLSFLLYARNGPWFRNFMNYDHHFTEDMGSQDCFGRCILSLGFTSARPGLPAGVHRAAEFLLRETLPGCHELGFIKSKAYALTGLCLWNNKMAGNILEVLSENLADIYEHNAHVNWKWFEEKITYCSAVLPGALLVSYEMTRKKQYLDIGLESLDFFLKSTFKNGIFQPVGCNGWFQEGKKASEFDQQPVEACGTILACLKAYEITRNETYRSCAKRCLEWYTGKNTSGKSLIDPDTGGCMDGITCKGLNRNEGAESLISWMIGSLSWTKYVKSLTRGSLAAL